MLCFCVLHFNPPPPALVTQQQQQRTHFPLPKLQLKTTNHFPHHHQFFPNFTKRNSGYSSTCLCSSSLPGPPEDDFEVELRRLLALLPEGMRRRVRDHEEVLKLIEVVMDLGRKPLARFPSGDFVLSDCPITVQDIEYATSQVGDFAIDNRAGISRTLHRISAIRNRKGTIIGLTCRVGRAITGSANLLRDLVQDEASLLLIGPPGVGKTTIIREVARMLANDYKKRVMIVDTSNEIGGDGDIPHGGIGNARRMQVPNHDVQHKVLIEAVENHMPQVIVIDEIGTKLEAMAASTIAQRGIQLVATAHGITIENLIMNPSLEMLVGGVQSVTLGDEEANRRGVQKTVLERKGPSTFSCGVEIVSKTELRIHRSLEATVDAILSGRWPNVEIRKINSQGLGESIAMNPSIGSYSEKKDEVIVNDAWVTTDDEDTIHDEFTFEIPQKLGENLRKDGMPFCLYVYGVLESNAIQGIKELKLDAVVRLTDNISEAHALLALQSKLKKNPQIEAAAKSHDIPIYVTKTSSLVQITKAIRALINDHADGLKDLESEDKIKISEKIDALEEARIAIEQVVIPKGEPVELLPRPSSQILHLQMELVQKYKLKSETIGKEPDLCLRILPFQTRMDEDDNSSETDDADTDVEIDDFISAGSDTNGSPHGMDRLPFLPNL
ncbi:AAA domain-containing protein [Cephalotus follicularis]|uniref:AAA domain-containing protein n=1 Tax=Cephalotus follicularis TaxID=3775 RepID=A0A1Q3B8F0_CEPFO|nr:AAA domain-containing protein [Cephalotus follicularis]